MCIYHRTKPNNSRNSRVNDISQRNNNYKSFNSFIKSSSSSSITFIPCDESATAEEEAPFEGKESSFEWSGSTPESRTIQSWRRLQVTPIDKGYSIFHSFSSWITFCFVSFCLLEYWYIYSFTLKKQKVPEESMNLVSPVVSYDTLHKHSLYLGREQKRKNNRSSPNNSDNKKPSNTNQKRVHTSPKCNRYFSVFWIHKEDTRETVVGKEAAQTPSRFNVLSLVPINSSSSDHIHTRGNQIGRNTKETSCTPGNHHLDVSRQAILTDSGLHPDLILSQADLSPSYTRSRTCLIDYCSCIIVVNTAQQQLNSVLFQSSMQDWLS